MSLIFFFQYCLILAKLLTLATQIDMR